MAPGSSSVRWAFLGRLNRHGAPGNALLFDLVVNVTVLGISLLINGKPGEVPIALLASANVGYFLSIILALVAAWMMRSRRPQLARAFRSPPGLVGLGLLLAVFNGALLVGGGAAWGWRNVALGSSSCRSRCCSFTPRSALLEDGAVPIPRRRGGHQTDIAHPGEIDPAGLPDGERAVGLPTGRGAGLGLPPGHQPVASRRLRFRGTAPQPPGGHHGVRNPRHGGLG